MNKVLFCGPQYLNLDEHTGGIYKEMKLREKALQIHGWEVEYLNVNKIPNWNEIKVAHVFMANESTYGLVRKLKEKTKVVVSPIIDRHEGNHALKALIFMMRLVPKMHSNLTRMRSICSEADAVVVRSTEELEKLHYSFDVDSGDIIKLPYEKMCSEINVSKEKQVLFIGDLGNPRKNVLRLIVACDELGVQLILAGTIGTDDYCNKILNKIKKSATTEYLGVVSNDKKYQLLDSSKVFCLPSLMEGIGISAIEALDFGCEVVITKHGGVHDYFGNDAEYISPRSNENIKHAISKSINNERNTYSDKFKEFSFFEIGKQQANLYRRVISNEK